VVRGSSRAGGCDGAHGTFSTERAGGSTGGGGSFVEGSECRSGRKAWVETEGRFLYTVYACVKPDTQRTRTMLVAASSSWINHVQHYHADSQRASLMSCPARREHMRQFGHFVKYRRLTSSHALPLRSRIIQSGLDSRICYSWGPIPSCLIYRTGTGKTATAYRDEREHEVRNDGLCNECKRCLRTCSRFLQIQHGSYRVQVEQPVEGCQLEV
jgi:hypothetical protein